jgi:O-methyltransferase
MSKEIVSLLRRVVRKLIRPASGRISRLWLRGHREYFSRQWLFDTVAGFGDDCRIDGEYLEFGCGNGSSLIDMVQSIERYPRLDNMRFFVFDSFEGLPTPIGIDADELQRYERGDFACDLDRYTRNVERGGVDLHKVRCIAGWYDKTLTPALKQELGIQKASIILVDCDLYESTVPVLNFITDYIQTGTIVIFDDWYSYKGRLDRGEAKAFSEWLERNPHIQANEYHRCGRTMMSFILQVN